MNDELTAEMAARDQHEAQINEAGADAETVVEFWNVLINGGVPEALAIELVRARFTPTVYVEDDQEEEED